MAARTPFDSLAATTASDQPVTPESLGLQLLEAIPQLPLYTISLHDDRGDVLWLNEGELTHHEQAFVEEALQVLGPDPSQPGYENVLPEDRGTASVIPVRTPLGELLGLILVVTQPTGESVVDQLMNPQVRKILRKLAVVMHPSAAGGGRGSAAAAPPARRSMPSRRAPEPEPEDYGEEPEGYAQAGYDDDGGADEFGGEDLGMDGPSEVYEPAPPARRAAPPPPARPAARAPAAPARPIPPVPRQAPPPAVRPSAPIARTSRPVEDSVLPASVPTLGASTPAARPAASYRPGAAAPARPAPPPAARPPAAPSRPAGPGYAGPPPALPSANAAPARPGPRTTQSGGVLLPGGSSQLVAPAFPSYPSTGQTSPGTTPSPAYSGGHTPPGGVPAPAFGGAVGSARAPVRPAPAAGPALDLLPFQALRAGVKGRRFEVVPRAGRPVDSAAVQQLIAWLGANRAWSMEPTSFTINLPITVLEDERFLRDTATALRNHGVQGEILGFEIAEALYTQNRAQVERFITASEKIGCFLVIDDFSFDTAVLPLLRSRSVRLVKIDGKLTSGAQRDRLSEALVVASIQATRVLGVLSAAKNVDSPALQQWLRSATCDLAQGQACGGAQRLESLGG